MHVLIKGSNVIHKYLQLMNINVFTYTYAWVDNPQNTVIF